MAKDIENLTGQDLVDFEALITGIVGGGVVGLTTEQVQDIVGALVQDSATIDATYNDAGAIETLTVKPNTSQQRVAIQKGGVPIGLRQTLNLIQGSNVTLTTTDNSGADRVDITIDAVGGTGGGLTAEDVDDRVAALLVQGSGVTLNYNDAANTLTISASGTPGPPGPPDPGSYESRAAAAASTITNPASGGPKIIRTGGYAVYGDNGHGLYKWRSAGAPTDTTNPAYFSTVNGIWFELIPENGQIRIEQFGGKADFVVSLSGVTDNYTPFTKALDFIARSWTALARYAYRIVFGYGDYWFSQMIELHTTVHIKGQGPPGGVSPWPTWLWWPSTQTCILIGQNNTLGEGGTGVNTGQGNGSVVEGIAFAHRYATGGMVPLTNWNPLAPSPGQGIHGRVTCTVKDCSFTNIFGHAIYIHGGSGAGGAREGNANEFKIRDCEVHSCGGDGFRTIDIDSNAASVVGFTTRSCGACGIHSENSFVNTWTGIHIAGYGNWVVSHNGFCYQLIGGAGQTANGGTVEPGTEADPLIWYNLGLNTLPGNPHIIPWSPTLDFSLYRAPIWDGGGANVYIGPYVENSIAIAHVPGASMLVGGTLASTSMSNHYSQSGTFSKNPITQTQFLGTGTPEALKFGDAPYVSLGGENDIYKMGTNGGQSILKWGSVNVPGGGETFQFGYFLNRITMHSGYGDTFFIGSGWGTDLFGRSTPVANRGRFIVTDMILVDPQTIDGRRIASRTTRPTAGDVGTSGEQARGDFYYTTLPADFGLLGWSCVAGGTPGTFAGVPLTGLTSAIPQYNGDCVFENTSNTQFKIKYKGSDGVVRTGTITLS